MGLKKSRTSNLMRVFDDMRPVSKLSKFSFLSSNNDVHDENYGYYTNDLPTLLYNFRCQFQAEETIVSNPGYLGDQPRTLRALSFEAIKMAGSPWRRSATSYEISTPVILLTVSIT